MAVKIVDGYDRWSNRVADYVAYFATDLDFYPIAWEMYDKKGEWVHTYWIESLKTIPLSEDGKVAFRYPDAAIFRNDAMHGIYEELKFPDLESGKYPGEEGLRA